MKKIFSAIALMTMVVAGCQQEGHEPVSPDVQDSVVFEAQTEDFNAPTKTSMTSKLSVVWSEGDNISIFQGCTLADQFQVSSGAGTQNATFTKVDPENFVGGTETTFGANVAFYPYEDDLRCTAEYSNEAVVSYKIENVTFPSEQTYVEGSFPNGAFPMVALTSSTNDKTLKFKNICGVMKFYLTGDVKVRSITLTGNASEPLAGEATVRVYTDGTTVPSIEMAEGANKAITLNCGDGVQLSKVPTAFMIAVPPTAFESGFRAVINNADNSTAELTTSNANPVRRSIIKAMPEKGIGSSTGLNTADAKDLSSSGTCTANCYIVSSPGKYMFPTVKGNSTESVGNVLYCDVLWESYGTATAITEGDLIKKASYTDDKIVFQTADTFKEGNAVIAAKDASGNILWSWHVWMTDAPVTHIYPLEAGSMMDRNLGATFDATRPPYDPQGVDIVPTLGLLYQWGRKDPFLGSSTVTAVVDQDIVEASSTITWPSPVGSDESTGTIQYATNNPTTFIYSEPTNATTSDWLYTIDKTRWGSNKTIYDPCPPGWRVPDGGTNGIWSKGHLHHYLESGCGILWRANPDTGSSGFVYYFYPFAGYKVGYAPYNAPSLGKLSQVGNFGYYWSSTPHENFNTAYILMFYEVVMESCTVDMNSATFDLAHGCPVRCMKSQ